MRTFAQKAKKTQNTKPAQFVKTGHVVSGQSRELNTIFQLQQTIGNQDMQRFLWSNAEEFERGSATTTGNRYSHDFSRIHVYPKARTDDIHRIAQDGTAGTAGPLPYLDHIQRFFGPRYDLGRVKAYVGGQAADATRRIGAEAYTSGERVAFGVWPSLRTAVHEATHVVQQRSGVQLHYRLGQNGDKYEQHADQIANEVVAGRSAEGNLDKFVGGCNDPASPQKQTVQFWGPEHADFTGRAVDRWNKEHPTGTFMHIVEYLKNRMVRCSDDPDHTGRAYDYLIARHKSDRRIYADFLISGKEKRRKEYAEADPAKKVKLYDVALKSVCPSEGPTHGEGNRPFYGSGGRPVNHDYMMSQIKWADRFTFGVFMSPDGAAQLGDAMHCAQDRGSHCEGNRHEGHDDVRDKLGIKGYDTDDPTLNSPGAKIADSNSDTVLVEFAKLRN